MAVSGSPNPNCPLRICLGLLSAEGERDRQRQIEIHRKDRIRAREGDSQNKRQTDRMRETERL